MSALGRLALVLRYAARAGFSEYYSIYTWKTWLTGWYVRIVAQVVFFALIGKLLGSEAKLRYLVVGNAVLLTAMVSLFAVASTTWERSAGTLPLLVASPTSAVVVFAGRSVSILGDALLSSLGAFVVLAPLYGVPLPWPRVLLLPVLLLVVGLSVYTFGIFLGGLVLRAPSARNVASNVALTTLMALGGVNVRVGFYPQAAQWLAAILPVTQGLEAVRGLLGGADSVSIAAHAGLALLDALGWLVLALLSFDRLVSHGRRDGSIEFGA